MCEIRDEKGRLWSIPSNTVPEVERRDRERERNMGDIIIRDIITIGPV